ncbi:MAG: VacJ family lipoprotein [Desulfosalsimonas sp.]|uniref:MlaA family lipoprotein n=1 Tax=Desulfosalsimonas sp. TaxID=3073848 RepID=UPI003970AFD4
MDQNHGMSGKQSGKGPIGIALLAGLLVFAAAWPAWAGQPSLQSSEAAAVSASTGFADAADQAILADQDQAGQESVNGSADGFDEFDEFDEFDGETGSKPVADPLSGYNRWMTGVNDKLYFWALKPAATGYAKVTPAVARRSVGRFFKNLGYPLRFVNNLLQLKIRRAGVETARFVVNTTVGVAGFADPARWWMDMEAYPEDFGQTLGFYGVKSGFHLVLPVMGPSNLRDAVSKIPDRFLNPVAYVDPSEASIAISAYDRINYTSLHLGEYESLKKDAVDWYIFLRNAYEQNRKKKIQE